MTGILTMLSTSAYLRSYNIVSESDIKKSGLKLPKETRDQFKAIEGITVAIDTPEEFITAAYFSPVQIVDASAAAAVEKELPHSDPRTAGLKLGAMWYKKIVEMQFCDPANTAQLANYELAMRTIAERTGVTRDEMISFYKAGIKDVVAEAVNQQFNTISFVISSPAGSFNSKLIRNPSTGTYTLTYERPSLDGDDKAITAASLEILLTEMAKSPDFNAACVEVVKQKSAFIPGVVFEDWAIKFTPKTDCLALIKEVITNFYINPSQTNYKTLLQIYARYDISRFTNPFAPIAITSILNTLSALNSKLATKYSNEASAGNSMAIAQQPLDAKYNPLFTTYGIGGGK